MKYPHWMAVLVCLALAWLAGGCDCDRESCDCEDEFSPSDDDTTDDDTAAADDDQADDDGADDDTSDDDTEPDFGLTWVPVPQGEFSMGCSPGDTGCNPDELPAHQVFISDFEISAYEVTQEQYLTVIGVNPSYFTPANGFAECLTCPVEGVSWFDATEFCTRVGGRLPTEAEWEYAARAGTTTRTYCGDDLACLEGVAWYSENSGEQTHPVGGLDANDWGLYDVLGNVWEWANDWYSDSYYTFSPTNDPPGAEDGDFRVLRGGSWIYDSDAKMTVSDRFLHSPEHAYSYIGFRCARY